MNQIKKLTKLLNDPGIIVMPGASDALTAKVIERVGFKAVFTTGYGSSATILGQPDRGLLDFHEMVSKAAQIAEAVDIPVFADADTGYGNVLNVIRTVREFEKSGVAGIFIEDQLWPKRCGHMEGKQVVPAEEIINKIKAAVEARKNKDFKIMIRTDARMVLGLDEAIRRGRMGFEAGADLVFVEAPQSVEELKIVARELNGIPLMANMVERGKTPLLTNEELEEMGYKMVVYPLTALYASTRAMFTVLRELMEKGTTKGVLDELVRFEEFNDLVGLNKLIELENRYN